MHSPFRLCSPSHIHQLIISAVQFAASFASPPPLGTTRALLSSLVLLKYQPTTLRNNTLSTLRYLSSTPSSVMSRLNTRGWRCHRPHTASVNWFKISSACKKKKQPDRCRNHRVGCNIYRSGHLTIRADLAFYDLYTGRPNDFTLYFRLYPHSPYFSAPRRVYPRSRRFRYSPQAKGTWSIDTLR
ncbi:hypothetical protein PM082_022380 [Marasmius tenuissimus]|nr:hypothetical protein PM082_022380 [Marasmius tenuissimus]